MRVLHTYRIDQMQLREAAGILEVHIDATQREIDAAYRKKSLRCHPDKNLDNKEDAEVQFKLISSARDMLQKHKLASGEFFVSNEKTQEQNQFEASEMLRKEKLYSQCDAHPCARKIFSFGDTPDRQHIQQQEEERARKFKESSQQLKEMEEFIHLVGPMKWKKRRRSSSFHW